MENVVHTSTNGAVKGNLKFIKSDSTERGRVCGFESKERLVRLILWWEFVTNHPLR